jgi:hypothetical protein
MNSLHSRATVFSFAFASTVLCAAPALAHDVLYHAHLGEAEVVNPDGSMGTGSTAHGMFEMQADEHSLAFDVFELTVDGIFVDDLDPSFGPNGTAFQIHWGAPGVNGPMLIDLGWYVDAGFGSLTPTATGFTVAISGIVTAMQGAYDMEGTTGLTPEDVFVEMEAGNTYVTVRTHAFPGGEIRGQLEPEHETPVLTVSWGAVKSRY